MPEIINEVYFGKTDTIKAIEKQLGAIRKKYMKKYTAKVDSDPAVTKFNRLVEKQFGFGTFALSILPSEYMNAFTVPIDNNYSYTDLNHNLMVDEKTFKYNKEADYSAMVFIYSGLLFNPMFTDAECLGIILHEIGHNFYATLDGKLGVVARLYNITNKMRRVAMAACKDKDSTAMEKNIGMELRGQGWDKTDGWLNATLHPNGVSIVDKIFDIFNKMTLGLFPLAMSLYMFIHPAFHMGLAKKYRNERIADNFAAMYGYGSDLNSALYKINDSADAAKEEQAKKEVRIPIISSIYDLNMTAAYVLLSSIDEHPGDLQRCQDQVALVEREVEKQDLDPKMRKVLQADLKACKAQLGKLNDQIAKIDDKNKAKNIFMRGLYNLSKYDDVRKCLKFDDKHKFDNYDIIYDTKMVQNNNKG